MSDGTQAISGASAYEMVTSVREAIAGVAGPLLVGLYLFGSLATGDFEEGVSDIDLIAVLSDPPNDELVARLDQMHADLAAAFNAWAGRIEVIYISAHGLANCRTDATTIAVISPGEPLHVVEASRDWNLNWYPAREESVALAGPPIQTLIPPIPFAEFAEQVRASLMAFPGRIEDDAHPGSQAYAILTMCRGLFTIRFDRRPSKREAAAWAQREFPQWADLIARSLAWRQRQWEPGDQNGTTTVSETRRFVAEMAQLARE